MLTHPVQNDAAVFHRLSKCLEGARLELGHFIEKENPVIGECDLAGDDRSSASNQAHSADAVVGGSKWTSSGRNRVERKPGNPVYRHRREALAGSKWRQDSGNALGKHGFAGAGGAAEQQVVVAGCRDLERSFGEGLSVDIGEIRLHSRVGARALPCDVRAILRYSGKALARVLKHGQSFA